MKEKLFQAARNFLRMYFAEEEIGGFGQRLEAVKAEIDRFGHYEHTSEEIEFGAKVAWRNSNRCIGRLFWKSLKVRDKRGLTAPEDIFNDLRDHLAYAYNGGKIRSVISVYRASRPNESEIRILNPQLIRYGGYQDSAGKVTGDKAMLQFTRFCQEHGWKGEGTPFDILPVLIDIGQGNPNLYEFAQGEVKEIPVLHSGIPHFAELGLRWYTVPVISNMVLEIGGIHYTAAPFNGWYMLTEIGSRNFGDKERYNMLPEVARVMGIDCDPDGLWKDKAMVVLNEAVLQSFREEGVTLTTHHDASEQFVKFCQREAKAGRQVTADWSWIVPPSAGSATNVFHMRWDNSVFTPNFFYRKSPWEKQELGPEEQLTECPFYLNNSSSNTHP